MAMLVRILVWWLLADTIFAWPYMPLPQSRHKGAQISSTRFVVSRPSEGQVSDPSYRYVVSKPSGGQASDTSLGAAVSKLIINYWKARGVVIGGDTLDEVLPEGVLETQQVFDQDNYSSSDKKSTSISSPQVVRGDWCYPECVTNRSAVQDLYDCNYFFVCLHIHSFGNDLLSYRCKCPDERPIFNPYLKRCRSAGRCSNICTSKSNLYATWPKFPLVSAILGEFECQYDPSKVTTTLTSSTTTSSTTTTSTTTTSTTIPPAPTTTVVSDKCAPKCVKHGTRVEDPTSCHHYYFCQIRDGHRLTAIRTRCPPIRPRFDVRSLSCVDRALCIEPCSSTNLKNVTSITIDVGTSSTPITPMTTTSTSMEPITVMGTTIPSSTTLQSTTTKTTNDTSSTSNNTDVTPSTPLPLCSPKCLTPNSIVHDPINCHHYYKCIFIKGVPQPMHIRCPSERPIFDLWTRSCQRNAECIRTCEDTIIINTSTETTANQPITPMTTSSTSMEPITVMDTTTPSPTSFQSSITKTTNGYPQTSDNTDVTPSIPLPLCSPNCLTPNSIVHDPIDCHHYYKCFFIKGVPQPTHIKCPTERPIFDLWTRSCQKNAECIRTCEDTIIINNSTNVPSKQTSTTQSPGFTEPFTTALLPITTDTATKCEPVCTINGAHVEDPINCHFYYYCHFDKALMHIPCPKSRPIFDPTLQKCVENGSCIESCSKTTVLTTEEPMISTNIVTSSTISVYPTTKSPPITLEPCEPQCIKPNTIVHDALDCHKYYICMFTDGKMQSKQVKCPSEKPIFDLRSQLCKKDVPCIITCEDDMNITNSTTPSPSHKCKPQCTMHGAFAADPTNCRHYYICDLQDVPHPRLTRKTCPHNRPTFNAQSQSCKEISECKVTCPLTSPNSMLSTTEESSEVDSTTIILVSNVDYDTTTKSYTQSTSFKPPITTFIPTTFPTKNPQTVTTNAITMSDTDSSSNAPTVILATSDANGLTEQTTDSNASASFDYDTTTKSYTQSTSFKPHITTFIPSTFPTNNPQTITTNYMATSDANGLTEQTADSNASASIKYDMTTESYTQSTSFKPPITTFIPTTFLTNNPQTITTNAMATSDANDLTEQTTDSNASTSIDYEQTTKSYTQSTSFKPPITTFIPSTFPTNNPQTITTNDMATSDANGLTEQTADSNASASINYDMTTESYTQSTSFKPPITTFIPTTFPTNNPQTITTNAMATSDENGLTEQTTDSYASTSIDYDTTTKSYTQSTSFKPPITTFIPTTFPTNNPQTITKNTMATSDINGLTEQTTDSYASASFGTKLPFTETITNIPTETMIETTLIPFEVTTNGTISKDESIKTTTVSAEVTTSSLSKESDSVTIKISNDDSSDATETSIGDIITTSNEFYTTSRPILSSNHPLMTVPEAIVTLMPQCQVKCNIANSRLSNPFNCHNYFKCVHRKKEGMVVRPYRCPVKKPVFNSGIGMCVSDASCINPCEMTMLTSPQTLVFPSSTSPKPVTFLPDELITNEPTVNNSNIFPIQTLPLVLPTKTTLLNTKPATSSSHLIPTNILPIHTLPALLTTVGSLVTSKPIVNQTDISHAITFPVEIIVKPSLLTSIPIKFTSDSLTNKPSIHPTNTNPYHSMSHAITLQEDITSSVSVIATKPASNTIGVSQAITFPSEIHKLPTLIITKPTSHPTNKTNTIGVSQAITFPSEISKLPTLIITKPTSHPTNISSTNTFPTEVPTLPSLIITKPVSHSNDVSVESDINTYPAVNSIESSSMSSISIDKPASSHLLHSSESTLPGNSPLSTSKSTDLHTHTIHPQITISTETFSVSNKSLLNLSGTLAIQMLPTILATTPLLITSLPESVLTDASHVNTLPLTLLPESSLLTSKHFHQNSTTNHQLSPSNITGVISKPTGFQTANTLTAILTSNYNEVSIIDPKPNRPVPEQTLAAVIPSISMIISKPNFLPIETHPATELLPSFTRPDLPSTIPMSINTLPEVLSTSASQITSKPVVAILSNTMIYTFTEKLPIGPSIFINHSKPSSTNTLPTQTLPAAISSSVVNDGIIDISGDLFSGVELSTLLYPAIALPPVELPDSCFPSCAATDLKVQDPRDCRYFYICKLSAKNTPTPFRMKCPKERPIFSVDEKECVREAPCKVKCVVPPFITKPIIPDLPPSLPAGIDLHPNCEIPKCDTPDIWLADPASCYHYYICHFPTPGLPKPLRLKCPKERPIFDSMKNSCQADGMCKIECKTNNKCMPHCSVNEISVPDPQDCNHFYICLNIGLVPRPIRATCPKSKPIYDAESRSCVKKGKCNISCDTLVSSPKSLSTTIISQLVSKDVCKPACLRPGLIVPDPYTCNSYYVCRDNMDKPLRMKCPKHFPIFDKYNRSCSNDSDCKPVCEACVPPKCTSHNQVIPYPRDCGKYILCSDYGNKELKPYTINCPKHSPVFDTLEMKCSKNTSCVIQCPESSITTTTEPPITTNGPVIPGHCLHEGYIAASDQCVDHYNHCYYEGSTLVEIYKRCPPGQVFNTDSNYPYCVPPNDCPYDPSIYGRPNSSFCRHAGSFVNSNCNDGCCQEYIECIDTYRPDIFHPVMSRCPGDLVFNSDPMYPVCILQSNCPTGHMHMSECNEEGNSPACSMCCRDFYHCTRDGHLQLRSCPSNLVFNPHPSFPYCILPEQCPNFDI